MPTVSGGKSSRANCSLESIFSASVFALANEGVERASVSLVVARLGLGASLGVVGSVARGEACSGSPVYVRLGLGGGLVRSGPLLGLNGGARGELSARALALLFDFPCCCCCCCMEGGWAALALALALLLLLVLALG